MLCHPSNGNESLVQFNGMRHMDYATDLRQSVRIAAHKSKKNVLLPTRMASRVTAGRSRSPSRTINSSALRVPVGIRVQ